MDSSTSHQDKRIAADAMARPARCAMPGVPMRRQPGMACQDMAAMAAYSP